MLKKRALLWSLFAPFSPGPEPKKQNHKNCAGEIGDKIHRVTDPSLNKSLAVLVERRKAGNEQNRSNHRCYKLVGSANMGKRPESKKSKNGILPEMRQLVKRQNPKIWTF